MKVTKADILLAVLALSSVAGAFLLSAIAVGSSRFVESNPFGLLSYLISIELVLVFLGIVFLHGSYRLAFLGLLAGIAFSDFFGDVVEYVTGSNFDHFSASIFVAALVPTLVGLTILKREQRPTHETVIAK